MKIRVAINGPGRLGRAILKLVINEPSPECVTVNALASTETLAYCSASTRRMVGGDNVVGDKRRLVTLQKDNPSDLPRKELGNQTIHRIREHPSSISTSPK